MKKFFFTIAASAICGISFAQTFSVSDVDVKPGDKVKADLTINIPESFASNYLNGFEFEKLVVPEGVTVTDIIPNAEWDAAAQGGMMTGDGFFYGGLLSFADDGLLPLGRDFVIASLEIEVDASFEPGQVLKATFPAGTKFTFTPGVYLDAADASFNINVVSSYAIELDENSETDPVDAEGVNVKVKRSIPANSWSSICLPFAMTAEQVKAAFGNGVKLANFSSWSSEEDDEGAIVAINVGFTEVTEMEANHPYVIKVEDAITEFSVEGVDIVVEADPELVVGKGKTKGTMYGTYKKTTVPEETVFLSGNKFWYSIGLTELKGFRGYFEFRDVLDAYFDEAPARFNFILNDATGIHQMTIGQSDGEYYDLRGQRVETPSKGIYIKDGKKVVVK